MHINNNCYVNKWLELFPQLVHINVWRITRLSLSKFVSELCWSVSTLTSPSPLFDYNRPESRVNFHSSSAETAQPATSLQPARQPGGKPLRSSTSCSRPVFPNSGARWKEPGEGRLAAGLRGGAAARLLRRIEALRHLSPPRITDGFWPSPLIPLAEPGLRGFMYWKNEVLPPLSEGNKILSEGIPTKQVLAPGERLLMVEFGPSLGGLWQRFSGTRTRVGVCADAAARALFASPRDVIRMSARAAQISRVNRHAPLWFE